MMMPLRRLRRALILQRFDADVVVDAFAVYVADIFAAADAAFLSPRC